MGALNIKDTDVAAKARKLAKLTGKSITAAVSEALDASLKTAKRKGALDREALDRNVEGIKKRFRASIPRSAPPWRKVVDDMYDENGLPK